MSALRANYYGLSAGEHKTDQIYANKSNVEGAIAQAELALSNGSLVANKTVDRPFNMLPAIELYQLQHAADGKQFVTWVGPKKQPGIVRAALRDVSLEVGGAPFARSFYYAQSGLYVEADYDLKRGTEGVFDRARCDWYISRPEFNTAIRDVAYIGESEWGTRYPSFPNDYSLLAADAGRRLNVEPDFANRHIILNITPLDKNGIAGEAMQSAPLFFCGLPTTRHLTTHLDAALIDLQTPQSSSGEVENDHLNAWYDAAHGVYFGVVEGAQPAVAKQPVDGDFVGQYIQFEPSTYITVDNRTLSDFSDFTAFMVINNVNGGPVFDDNTNVSNLTAVDINGDWRLVVCDLQCTSPFVEIGYGDYQLVEFIAYNDALDRAKKLELMARLAEKYRPLKPRTKIDRLQNISATAKLGALYVMPVAATAIMPDGTSRLVPVVWDEAITNDQVGVFNVRGHLLGNEENELTYSLTVETDATVD